MNYANLLSRLYNTPHMVLPAYAHSVAQVLGERANFLPVIEAKATEVQKRTARSPQLHPSGILVMPIVGGLYHRGDALDAMSGAQSYTFLTNQLREAMADPNVKGILLDIDSPGGQVSGCFEFCEALTNLSRQKPIRAIANSLCASAAYAIASSCDHIYAIPSADVGSIGIYMMHVDVSKQIEARGLKVTMVHAGAHKIDGNPYEPLPDSVRAVVQAKINDTYDTFVKHVADTRGLSKHKVRNTEAGVFGAEAAMEIGLVDEVASYDAAISDFAASFKTAATSTPERRADMAQNTTAPSGADSIEAAIGRAYADGQKAAKVEAQTEIAAAYSRGRSDAAAIVNHAEAGCRLTLAAELAGDASLSVERATSLLAKTPKSDDASATATNFRARVAANAPNVRSGDDGKSASQPTDGGNDFMAGVVGMLNRSHA